MQLAMSLLDSAFEIVAHRFPNDVHDSRVDVARWQLHYDFDWSTLGCLFSPINDEPLCILVQVPLMERRRVKRIE